MKRHVHGPSRHPVPRSAPWHGRSSSPSHRSRLAVAPPPVPGRDRVTPWKGFREVRARSAAPPAPSPSLPQPSRRPSRDQPIPPREMRSSPSAICRTAARLRWRRHRAVAASRSAIWSLTARRASRRPEPRSLRSATARRACSTARRALRHRLLGGFPGFDQRPDSGDRLIEGVEVRLSLETPTPLPRADDRSALPVPRLPSGRPGRDRPAPRALAARWRARRARCPAHRSLRSWWQPPTGTPGRCHQWRDLDECHEQRARHGACPARDASHRDRRLSRSRPS